VKHFQFQISSTTTFILIIWNKSFPPPNTWFGDLCWRSGTDWTSFSELYFSQNLLWMKHRSPVSTQTVGVTYRLRQMSFTATHATGEKIDCDGECAGQEFWRILFWLIKLFYFICLVLIKNIICVKKINKLKFINKFTKELFVVTNLKLKPI
jgi:hypothetical protein